MKNKALQKGIGVVVKILEMKNITKKFGEKVVANDHVNFDVEKGEVHALLGENGAGKSTLMNILCGIYPATEGEISYLGKPLKLRNASDAQKAGIGMVHQHFMIIPNMTVIENIVLGTKTAKVLNLKKAAEKFNELAVRYGLEIDPWTKVSDISVGGQQRLEILKVLYKGAELIVLDEPTAILTPEEVAGLYKMIRTLVSEGRTIIFITHKMKEVMDICDRCTVLRNGKSIQTVKISEIENVNKLANMMVGKEIELTIHKKECYPGREILRLLNVECEDENGQKLLSNINLQLFAGEILGVAGVDGNGQSELAACVSGLRKTSAGAVIVDGNNITNTSVKKVLDCGVAHIPEDRQRFGLVGDMNVMENLILMSASKEHYSKRGLMDFRWIEKHCREVIEDFDVKTPDTKTLAKHLSGGNQQKLVIGRELEWGPKLIIAMHPDRGLDIGATKYIQNRLIKERDRGAGILMISTELDEIMELSDRIMVMYEGQIAGILDGKTATREQVGILMAGGSLSA